MHTYIFTYVHTCVCMYICAGTKNRKGNYNFVNEVGPQTGKQILHTKLKMGWGICNVEDYLVPTSCYRCSRFNYKYSDCKGDETCPHCAGKHKLKECTARASEHTCITCITFRRYNKKDKISENRSALSKDCASLEAVLIKYMNNMEY